jgi:hypothetical protein
MKEKKPLIIFLVWGKTYNGAFLGVFPGGPNAKGNFRIKKVSAPSKNPAKCPIICFACAKKIIYRTFKIKH